RETIAVLSEICLKEGASLKRLGKEIRLTRHRNGGFSYADGCTTYKRLECALIGKHQQENAAMAVGAAEELRRKGFLLDENAVRRGLANTRWEGRMEVVHEEPLIILDGAHNPAGVKILCDALDRDFSFRKLVIVFGVLGDKDFRSMIRKLAKRADRLILTKPDSSRAVPPVQLLQLAAPYCREVVIEEYPPEAIKTALAWSLPEDLILIAGSLYLVGQAKKILPSLTH
ncbi:MAG: cyanophycin synthetase, partial [Smithellaceae bacterium]|nr:cyanophycin synthetase [Smithellaceae bacterium]